MLSNGLRPKRSLCKTKPRVPCFLSSGAMVESAVLGIGSYGKVCRATYGKLSCAAKLLHDTMFNSGDPGATKFAERFKQECQFLGNIRHPNIVQYLGIEKCPLSGRPILLMELMDISLTKYLEQSTSPLPYHTQVNICNDVALALAYLHSNNIIHRDLSGNNVILIGDGIRAKVTDFGMSTIMEANPHFTSLTTCPGAVVYMPPEALTTPPRYSAKLDCFSFGVLTIQIITRKFPKPTDAMITIQERNGRVVRFVPERERRQNHIDLIHTDHPLLPLMLQCIRDRDTERPSAEEICDMTASLKSEQRYLGSVEESKKLLTVVQRLEIQIQERGRKSQNKEKELQDRLQAREKEFQDMEKEFQDRLQKREKEFQDREKELQDRFQDKERDFQDRERNFRDKEKDFQDRERNFQDRERDFQDRERDFQDSERDFQDRERDFQDRERDFQDRERDFQDREKELQDELKDREREFQDKEKDFQTNMNRNKQVLTEQQAKLKKIASKFQVVLQEAETYQEQLECSIQHSLTQTTEKLTIAPDYKTQKAKIHSALQRRLSKGDTWYLVTVQWMKQWKKYVGYDESDQSLAGKTSANPGAINNSTLFKDSRKNILKERLMEEKDYYLLSEPAWTKLVDWYGLTEDLHPIPRRVLEHGLILKNCKVEVYLLEFKLTTTRDLADQNVSVKEHFSRSETVGQLEDKLKEIFHISDTTKCHVWHRHMTNTYQLLTNYSQTLQEAGLSNRETILLEVKDEDGLWPRERGTR